MRETERDIYANGASAHRPPAPMRTRVAIQKMEPGRLERYRRAQAQLYSIVAVIAMILGMLIAFLEGKGP